MTDEQTNELTIIKFEAENFMRLHAVSITPKGNVVTLCAANAQGKSACLDAIEAVLAGGKAMKDIAEPIHRGETKARAFVDLGTMTVTRKWSAKGTTLVVEGKDGTKLTSPQKVLDEMYGLFAFDPLEFAGMSSKEQVAALQEIVTLDIDLDGIANQRQSAFEERTNVNREVKTLAAQLKAAPLPDVTPPAEEVASADILAEMEAAQARAASNEKDRKAVEDFHAEAANLQLEINSKQEKLATMIEQGKQMRENVDSLVDPAFEEIRERLHSVEETNKAVRAHQEHHKIKAQLDGKEEKAFTLTARIESLDDTKAEGLREATFPVDGLSFGDDGVTYNDMPFTQASSAERLRVSFAIAMALNPQLKVIQIRNGNLLDSKNLAQIGEMAKANGFQVWMEMVDESGKIGVVIEDGRVVADNQ